ncbi:unnamed protein product [Cuscuta europaea]|uniref:Transposase (putative) gypsy type domain-containing protein n=1 Tax=Cuscuta europaea TaxID=41803 RepID=A0A9P1E5B4_CUSEU|nr:unnamed protein product [Cuscuta europaea]
MSSQSDSQDISGEPSVEMVTCSDVESSSVESSAAGDAAVAMEVEKDLQAEVEAEGFEQENEDEELALAVQTAEQEEERERLKVTVAIPPPRGAGEASSSRPLDPTPISVAPGKKNKTKAAPRKKQAAVDAGRPVGIPEGHSFLNTAALELKTKASPAEYQSTQMLVGPSARVVEPRADDLLRYAPEGCFAAHTLSVEMGLRFPLHPFLLEYLRFVGLAPCQLTPNSHSYVAGFLSLCQSRGVEPTLDQFFMSFNLCRGGHSNAEGFANLQQVPEFRLFDDVTSSHKGWKERFCYIRLEENPFPAQLRNSFQRHPKVGSAALEKNDKVLAKKPEGSDKHVKIREVTLPEDLLNLCFRQFRPRGSSDERYPPLDRVFEGAGGSNMDVGSLFALKNAKGKKKAPAGAPSREGPSQTVGAAAGAGGSKGFGPVKKKVAGKGAEPPAKKPKTAAPTKQPITDVVVIVDEGHASASTPRNKSIRSSLGGRGWRR